jgi:hypothetical protein
LRLTHAIPGCPATTASQLSFLDDRAILGHPFFLVSQIPIACITSLKPGERFKVKLL